MSSSWVKQGAIQIIETAALTRPLLKARRAGGIILVTITLVDAHLPMNDPKPQKRLVLCRGQFCNIDRRADKLYRTISPLIDALNGEGYPPRVRLVTANCLSMCGAGPNCIIQPGGRPFNKLDADRLREIVERYLKDN